jgi:hypothetical protein
MQDWKDSDLKSLFSEGRARDHKSATRFQTDWEQARSKMAASSRVSFKYAIAIASVAAIALSAALVIRIIHAPSPQSSPGTPEQSAGLHDLVGHPSVAPGPPQPDPSYVPQPTLPKNGKVAGIERVRNSRKERRKYVESEVYQDNQLISTWRSPTDFLLKSPGRDFLNRVPNIDDSLVRIDGR